MRKINYWTAEGITVVGFRTPASQTIMALEDSLSDFPLEQFKETFLKNGGQWIEIDPHRYRTFDGNHLERESALQLSSDLADSVAVILTSDPPPSGP